MTMSEYQALAQRTASTKAPGSKIENGCLGLIGEAGEVADLVKKWMYQSGEEAPLPREKLIEELGDVLWYCAELCAGLESDIADVYPDRVDRLFVHRWAIDAFAAHLAARAVRPWHTIYGEEHSPCPDDRRKEIALVHVCEIMAAVDEMLYLVHSSLTEAMERNIDKLRRRYPEGFDPERSRNRDE